MNIFINGFLFLLLTTAFFTYAKPNKIKSATENPSGIITVVEGKTIFSNGVMQAKIRVILNNKELDIADYNIKLKEYGTGVDLAYLNWQVSPKDNGFDHSFGAVSSTYNQSHSASNKVLKNYADLFISTVNENANIVICFEIKNKNNSLLFSSCHDHGIDRGSVEIYAKRPFRFSSFDFEETPKIKIFHVGYEIKPEISKAQPLPTFKNELIGYSFGLKARANVPREFKFNLKHQEPSKKYSLILNDFDADRRKAYIKTSAYGDTSYIERYLFIPPKKSTRAIENTLNFSVYNITAQKKGIYTVFPTGDEQIIHILEVHYFNRSFMLKNMHCYDPDIKNPSIKYKCYKTTSDSTSYFEYDKDHSTWSQMYNQYSVDIQLEDNFGTIHNIKLEAYQ